MKIAFLLLAVIGLAKTAVIHPGIGGSQRHNVDVKLRDLRSLDDLLKQFASFIPFDKCLEIVNRYMETDPDVQKAWAFLKSDTFRALTDKVEAMQEYKDFLKYLYDSGLDIYTYENIIRQILGLPPIEHLTRHGWVRESGIIKMVKELLAVLPIDKIKDWFQNVCLPDPDFQKLIQRILSPDFQKLVDAVTSTPEYQELLNVLREQGIDVEAIEKAIDDFFHGLGRKAYDVNTRSLDDLLKQFASFIPIDKCLEIVNRYMETDPDVQKAWAFLKSDTFRALTDKVEAMQEYKDFLKYLYDSGLDIYTYENIIRQILGLPPIEHLTRHGWVRESGIIKMVKELLSVLPIDKIKDWFQNVCLPDPDFQKLIQRILSPDFQKLVDAVTSTPEYQELLNVLREQGIDVEAIQKAIDDFFHGLGSKAYSVNTRSLDDLLKQFASFIPIDKCLEIVNRYMETDPDVQKAWAFLKSDTFRALTDKVEAMQEYKDFLKYLYDSGLDIYTYENIIRQILGLPPIEHLTRHGWVRESGIIKMVKELLAVLPIDKIKDWFQNVCLPDPDFQKLIQRILSPDFQKLVDAVTSTPEYQELLNVLREQGIDVEAIQKAIDDFFHSLG